VKLLLDHHYSTEIAVQLRSRGHDVDAALERGWQGEDDEPLLTACSAEGRALLTNNVRDFTAIAQRWAVEGRTHGGLVFTTDASLPRSRRTIGQFVAAIDALLRAYPGDGTFADRVHWLPAPALEATFGADPSAHAPSRDEWDRVAHLERAHVDGYTRFPQGDETIARPDPSVWAALPWDGDGE
jgi:hypothetical protein